MRNVLGKEGPVTWSQGDSALKTPVLAKIKLPALLPTKFKYWWAKEQSIPKHLDALQNSVDGKTQEN